MTAKIRCGSCGFTANWTAFDPDRQTRLPYDSRGHPTTHNREGHTWVCPECDAGCTPASQGAPMRCKKGRELANGRMG